MPGTKTKNRTQEVLEQLEGPLDDLEVAIRKLRTTLVEARKTLEEEDGVPREE